MNKRRLIAPALALLLASCAPALPKPDTTVQVATYLPNQPVAASPMPAEWWRIFNNPALNALVETGLAANPGIGEAAQNLAAANANTIAATGAFRPQIGINPNLSRSAYPTGPNAYPPYTIYSLAGTISYDPGLFGARKYTFESATAWADYQAAELDAARQSVVGNIAAAAIAEAGAQQQIATTQRIITAEQQLLTLLQGEYADGAIPQLNVLQQQAVILASEATLPPLQTLADQQRDRLAILTGNLPAQFAPPSIALNALALPARVPVALPSAYLADRPDIRAARAEVTAQNAALGLAIAHLYPDLTLSAQGGYAAESMGMLFEPELALWTLAGNILAPLYEGGILHARKQASQSELAAALYSFRGTILAAFAQAADALQAVQNDQTTLARAEAADQTADAAYTLARGQFRLGAVDYTTVLTAQATAAQQALVRVQARTNLLLDIANLQAAMAK